MQDLRLLLEVQSVDEKLLIFRYVAVESCFCTLCGHCTHTDLTWHISDMLKTVLYDVYSPKASADSNQTYFGNSVVFQTRSLQFFIPQYHWLNLLVTMEGRWAQNRLRILGTSIT